VGLPWEQAMTIPSVNFTDKISERISNANKTRHFLFVKIFMVIFVLCKYDLRKNEKL
jgi:hypothetical protein